MKKLIFILLLLTSCNTGYRVYMGHDTYLNRYEYYYARPYYPPYYYYSAPYVYRYGSRHSATTPSTIPRNRGRGGDVHKPIYKKR